ncbi:MAG: TIGR04282 family arsenosugar biosynthesis glycosyltransferase [Burkholderiales bacterium]
MFAKAPVPGRVKTRLIPALGAAGAAKLQRQLIARTLRTVLAAGLGKPELWCAPDADDAFFAACANQHGIGLRPQGGGDLGERMARALESAIAVGSTALLIGCDCPALTPAYLREAAAALDEGNDAVFGPAEDGGYVLIAAARSLPAQLFEGIAWGTSTVMQATRARLAQGDWRWRELAPLWDIDRPEDLPRLHQLRAQRGRRNGQDNRSLPATLPTRAEEEESPRNRCRQTAD